MESFEIFFMRGKVQHQFSDFLRPTTSTQQKKSVMMSYLSGNTTTGGEQGIIDRERKTCASKLISIVLGQLVVLVGAVMYFEFFLKITKQQRSEQLAKKVHPISVACAFFVASVLLMSSKVLNYKDRANMSSALVLGMAVYYVGALYMPVALLQGTALEEWLTYGIGMGTAFLPVVTLLTPVIRRVFKSKST